MFEEIIFVLILILILVVVFIKFLWKKDSGKWKTDIRNRLKNLDQYANSNDPIQLKSILIEADKLMEHSLRKSGHKGQTTGEMLKNANKSFDKEFYNEIWQAHKARNVLVHEVNQTIPPSKISTYYQTLRKTILLLTK